MIPNTKAIEEVKLYLERLGIKEKI